MTIWHSVFLSSQDEKQIQEEYKLEEIKPRRRTRKQITWSYALHTCIIKPQTQLFGAQIENDTMFHSELLSMKRRNHNNPLKKQNFFLATSP